MIDTEETVEITMMVAPFHPQGIPPIPESTHSSSLISKQLVITGRLFGMDHEVKISHYCVPVEQHI